MPGRSPRLILLADRIADRSPLGLICRQWHRLGMEDERASTTARNQGGPSGTGVDPGRSGPVLTKTSPAGWSAGGAHRPIRLARLGATAGRARVGRLASRVRGVAVGTLALPGPAGLPGA